jgi:hypothetical protein
VSVAAARRARVAPLAAVAAAPALWLAVVIVVSVVVRYAFARRVVAPWIMIDEIVYSELAKSIAAGDGFAIRDEAYGAAYGVVYPLLLSPAFALWDSVPSAYAAAKAINSVLISLAAVPAYLLARTVVRPFLALVVAVLALAVPSTFYAGTLMTENAFYGLFLLVALTLVRLLERPSVIRIAVYLAAVGFAYLTRAQAVVLVGAGLLAPLVLVLLERGGLRGLRRFAGFYATVAALGVVAVAVQTARGRSLTALLGAYSSTGDAGYDVSETARYLLWHAAELDLYVAVVPVAALILLAAIAHRLDPSLRRLVAAALAILAVLLPVVAAFASRYALRIEERNMFYAAPLLFALLVAWIERGLPRPRPIAVAAALLAAVLPALVPFARFIGVSAQSDTLALLPWWNLHERGVPLDRLWIVALCVGVVLGLAFLLVPARWALALPGAVLGLYALALHPIEAGAHGVRKASVGALYQGITRPRADWIDRAVGTNARVDVLWSGLGDRLVVNENEFFSRSVRRVFHLREPTPGGLPEELLIEDPTTGLLRRPDGRPVRSSYALGERSADLAGAIVAEDVPKGLALVRVDNPLRARSRVDGLYADGWSHPTVRYTRYACRGGTLSVELAGDARLFDRDQTVRASSAGRTLAAGRVPADGSRARLTVPIPDAGGRRCTVRFDVAPTAVPGRSDLRRLGTHFLSFRFSR